MKATTKKQGSSPPKTKVGEALAAKAKGKKNAEPPVEETPKVTTSPVEPAPVDQVPMADPLLGDQEVLAGMDGLDGLDDAAFQREFKEKRPSGADRLGLLFQSLADRNAQGEFTDSLIPNMRFDYGILLKSDFEEWVNKSQKFGLPMMIVPISSHMYQGIPQGAAIVSYPVLDVTAFLSRSLKSTPEKAVDLLGKLPLREHKDIGAFYFSVTNSPAERMVMRRKALKEPVTGREAPKGWSLSDVQTRDFLETADPSKIIYVCMEPVVTDKVQIGCRFVPAPAPEAPKPKVEKITVGASPAM